MGTFSVVDRRAQDINDILDAVSVGENTADTVWHYTRMPALEAILTGNLVWACDAQTMNDKTELITGHNALVAALAAANIPEDLRGRVGELLAHSRELMERGTTFVLSASLDGDSLHQWTEYAGRDGFAVAFKVERGNINLLENRPFNPTPENPRDQSQYVSSWRDVVYDPVEHSRTAAAFIDLLARTLDPITFGADPDDGITNDYTVELFAPLPYAAIVTRLKNTNSAAENESRITATILNPDRFHGETPTGRAKVDLTGWSRPARITGASSYTSPAPTPLPIVEIRTGPNTETAALRELLDRTGYGAVRISASRHPSD